MIRLLLRLSVLLGTLLVSILLETERAEASDLKIVDSAGLIRAVRVVKDSSLVTVSLVEKTGSTGECVATNVDGIASERKAPFSQKSECIFPALVAGTWQITVTGGARWRVRIHE